MITAALLAAGCLWLQWLIGRSIRRDLGPRGPRIERRPSRRKLRGDMRLWDQETRS